MKDVFTKGFIAGLRFSHGMFHGIHANGMSDAAILGYSDVRDEISKYFKAESAPATTPIHMNVVNPAGLDRLAAEAEAPKQKRGYTKRQ